MLYFNRNGVWFTIPISKDAIYSRELLEKQIKSSLLGLQNLKDRSPGLDQMRFEKPGEYVIKSVFGRDDVLIYPSTIQKGKKKKIEREDTVYPYVLLVELGTQEVEIGGSYGNYLPRGFAIFEPSGPGDNPGGAGTINLKFSGWTNQVTENQDPPGIIGQSTYRIGWCKQYEGVEQIKRVDQGYLAYDGYPGDDEWDEEVTEVGTYGEQSTLEGIDYLTHWEATDPGPPPEDICGYTWAVASEYGGPGGGQYDDIEHLFYVIEVGALKTYVWPPEYNQLITKHSDLRKEGAACRYKDLFAPNWLSANEIGVKAALGDIVLPNTYSQIDIHTNDTKRYWGSVYGTDDFPLEDHVTSNDYPFLNYAPVDDAHQETAAADGAIDYGTDGVYVKNESNVPGLFIQGYSKYESGKIVEKISSYRYYKRENIVLGSEFTAEYIATLSDRQITILAGNESSVPDWPEPNYYTGLTYKEDSSSTSDLPDAVINCGGDEFIIKTEGFGYFYDYGIFTKKDTGVKNGAVDPATIDPIYAYSVDIGVKPECLMVYGMVMNGKHYRTEAFAVPGCDFDEIVIPGLENAVDKFGAAIKATSDVRIGIKKITVKEEIEVEDG